MEMKESLANSLKINEEISEVVNTLEEETKKLELNRTVTESEDQYSTL